MSAVVSLAEVDALLAGDVIAHLDAQLISARRLLQVVLEQAAAIRRRDVRSVVALTGVLQAELQRRDGIEQERSRLLERAGARLGVNPGAVSLGLLEGLMHPQAAQSARERSAELRGLLEEVKREHYCNRMMMRQELAFVDHLLRLAHGEGDAGYDSGGDRPTAAHSMSSGRHRMFDLEV
jgi:flagellar biosynthesis/type III secretory pathway chaperone